MPVILAAAPPGSDPNSDIAHWYQGLKTPSNPDFSCCGQDTDCRPTDYRTSHGPREVFISKKTFGPSAPDDWVVVPETAILHHHDNPTGEAIVCWFLNHIICYIPPPDA